MFPMFHGYKYYLLAFSKHLRTHRPWPLRSTHGFSRTSTKPEVWTMNCGEKIRRHEEGSGVLEPQNDDPQRFQLREMPKSSHGGVGTRLSGHSPAMTSLTQVDILQSYWSTRFRIKIWTPFPASVDETFSYFHKFPLNPALPIATLQWNIIILYKISIFMAMIWFYNLFVEGHSPFHSCSSVFPVPGSPSTAAIAQFFS